MLRLLSAIAASLRQEPLLIHFLQLLAWCVKVSQKQSWFTFLCWAGNDDASGAVS